jgi:hypothetical protein
VLLKIDSVPLNPVAVGMSDCGFPIEKQIFIFESFYYKPLSGADCTGDVKIE